jgi:hypothetical protein
MGVSISDNDQYANRRCWLCNKSPAEVDSLGIRQSGFIYPDGYHIDFPLKGRRIVRSKKNFPDLYPTLRLWLCPVCAQITMRDPIPQRGNE